VRSVRLTKPTCCISCAGQSFGEVEHLHRLYAAGACRIAIPKLRQGSYFPPFLEPRKTSEKALVPT